MAKLMSLAEFRKTVKLKGQKSRLFCLKAEIFEAAEMGMSLSNVVDFLALHGIQISKQALHRWISSQKRLNPAQKMSCKNQPNNVVQDKKETKVEPTPSTVVVDDRASKVRAKMGAAADDLPDGLLEMFSHQILNY